MLLAEHLAANSADTKHCYTSPFNFGPYLESNRPVRELVEEVLKFWPGNWQDLSDVSAPHESGRLHLQIDKARHELGWRPRWDFACTVARTVSWYKAFQNGASAFDCCISDLRLIRRRTLMSAELITPINGVFELTSSPHVDSRGAFFNIYRAQDESQEFLGLPWHFPS